VPQIHPATPCDKFGVHPAQFCDSGTSRLSIRAGE
jgi:hypothetical protein